MLEIKRYVSPGDHVEEDEYGDYVYYADHAAIIKDLSQKLTWWQYKARDLQAKIVELKAQIEVARAEGACEGQHLGFKIGYEDGFSHGYEKGASDWVSES